MGLLNWLKDKSFLKLEHDVKLLEARMEGIDMKMENVISQVRSIRSRGYKQKIDEEEEESTGKQPTMKDLAEIKEAFGGSFPIELIEKYKNNQGQ